MVEGNGGYIDYSKFEKPEGDTTLDARLHSAREAYSNAANDILERVALEFQGETPGDAAAQYVVQDFAMFVIFLAAAKMVELAEEPPHRKRFLSAFKYLIKRAEREVPEQIIALARSIQGGRAFEDGPAGEA